MLGHIAADRERVILHILNFCDESELYEENDFYTHNILEELEKKFSQRLDIFVLYVILEDLEKYGFIKTTVKDGGWSKYKITEAGKEYNKENGTFAVFRRLVDENRKKEVKKGV